MITFRAPLRDGFHWCFFHSRAEKMSLFDLRKQSSGRNARVLNCSAVWRTTCNARTGTGSVLIAQTDRIRGRVATPEQKSRGGPHTYINCDPILNISGALESWFQQGFPLHKGKKNSSHFGSAKVAILDDPDKGYLSWCLFSAFFGTFDSSKQRRYPLWEGAQNSSQFEAIKPTISNYPEY